MFFTFDLSVQARYWSDLLEKEYRPAALHNVHCCRARGEIDVQKSVEKNNTVGEISIARTTV